MVLYKHSQQHRLAKGARVWVEVRDRSELRSGSVVDLRVVDILVVDVRVDMDEVDSHRVVSNWDLSRVVITDTTLDLGLEVKSF